MFGRRSPAVGLGGGGGSVATLITIAIVNKGGTESSPALEFGIILIKTGDLATTIASICADRAAHEHLGDSLSIIG